VLEVTMGVRMMKAGQNHSL